MPSLILAITCHLHIEFAEWAQYRTMLSPPTDKSSAERVPRWVMASTTPPNREVT